MMDYEFKKHIKLEKLIESQNIAKLMDDDDVKYVGRCALEGYNEDKTSRNEWEIRSARSMELALQVSKEKSFPWTHCANVKIPLITVAALNYQARACTTLIDCDDLVKVRVFGEDPDGQKSARADRISSHMTWQNIRQDKGWEEAHDKALLVQAISGVAFIKRVFEPAQGHIVTQLVIPKDFVINYWTRELDSSPRYTHVYELSDNAIRQRELDGRFCKYDEAEEPQKEIEQSVGPLKIAQDERAGLHAPPISDVTPFQTGEQYCWLDLDGDEYAEPYIVTFDISTGRIRRIVARFLPSGVKKVGGSVYEITPVKVFTKIPFIPSPDGGFYDLGLGQLLGSINDSANTALNQIFDAGTMATLGGGFVGRGFKNRGGPFTFKPNEWYPVDAPGDDLRKNVLPLPVREPSNVLYQVLTFLLGWGERVVSANEIQLGENPGQNTPAETTRTLNENGARVYAGIYKRTWRAFGEEYCVQYDLNKLFLPHDEDYINLTTGKGALIRKDDYMGPALDIMPVADPYVTSDAQKVQQATSLLQASNQLPGFNRYQAGLRWLKVQKIPNIEAIYPPPMTQGPDGKPVPAPDFPPPPDPKMLQIQVQQGELQLKGQEFQLKAQQQQADNMRAQIELLNLVQESRAKVQNLQSQAVLYMAQAKSEEFEPFVKLIYAEIESEGKRGDRLLAAADMLMQKAEKKGANSGTDGGGLAGMAGQPSNATILAGATPGTPAVAGAMANGSPAIQ